MLDISANNAGDAWLKLCSFIMNKGSSIKDGNKYLKELLNVFIEIQNPTEIDSVLSSYADPKIIKWMREDNFGGTKAVLDWGYCYGMRFRNFNGFNQINYLAEKLKKNPEAKSAIISTMMPDVDSHGHVPCIAAVDFKIRNDQINTIAFFRSQDVGKKIYADVLSLGDIMDELSRSVGVKRGKLYTFIASAHIYEDDFKNVEEILKKNAEAIKK